MKFTAGQEVEGLYVTIGYNKNGLGIALSNPTINRLEECVMRRKNNFTEHSMSIKVRWDSAADPSITSQAFQIVDGGGNDQGSSVLTEKVQELGLWYWKQVFTGAAFVFNDLHNNGDYSLIPK